MKLQVLQLMFIFQFAFEKARSCENQVYKGYRFESSENGSCVDYEKQLFPPLQQMGICVRFFQYVENRAFRSTILHYKCSDDDEIHLYASWQFQQITLTLHEEEFKVDLDFQFNLRQWKSFCIAMDFVNESFVFVNEGEVREIPATNISSATPRPFCRLILAQFILEENSHYINSVQNFLGEIVDIKILEVFSIEFMINYTTCSSSETQEKVLINFSEKQNELIVNAIPIQIPYKDICSDHIEMLVPMKMNFQNSIKTCQMFGGKLFEPRSAEVFNQTYTQFLDHAETCSSFWSSFFWIGLKANGLGWWKFLSGTDELSYDIFIPGWNVPHEHFNCVVSGGLAFNYTLYTAKCDYPVCPLCSMPTFPVLKLQGLEPSYGLDIYFTCQGNRNGKLIFHGIRSSEISWNGNSWLIIDTNLAIKGMMFNWMKDDWPVGQHIWSLEKYNIQKNVSLLLTACNSDEMTCKITGTCLPKSKRCNSIINCDDSTDESNCEIMVTPPEYRKDMLISATLEPWGEVTFSLTINAIRKLSIVQSQISFDAKMQFSWLDARLQFRNLKENTSHNRAPVFDEIWSPEVVIHEDSSSMATMIVHVETLVVKKLGKPLPEDLTKVDDDSWYDGKENPLILDKIVSITCGCDFQLQLYPFDFQVCSIFVSMQDANKRTKFIQSDPVTFVGERKLLEYELVFVSMNDTVRETVLGQKVRLVFKNQYTYYLGNAFLPSMLMLIISSLVFLYDIGDFQNRVMVSLTSLLVLASLFAQTSQSIPKTAYLKLIDIWFIGLISENFLIIVGVVIVEYHRLSGAKKVYAANANRKRMTSTQLNAYLNYISRVLVVFWVIGFACFSWYSMFLSGDQFTKDV